MCPSLEIMDRSRKQRPVTKFLNSRCPKCKEYNMNVYCENEFGKGKQGLPEDPTQPYMLSCSSCGYRVFQTKLDTSEEDFNRIFKPKKKKN